MPEGLAPKRASRISKKTRRVLLWVSVTAAIVILVPVGFIAVPIIAHVDNGVPVQDDSGQQWPVSATTRGSDGRTRTITVAAVASESVPNTAGFDTSRLAVGQRVVVTGTGFDAAQGIYVAICVIPNDPATKPGPCLGGVPTQTKQDVAAGTTQFAPSNWINDQWAWKLFGSRSYDDAEAGTFHAYLEITSPVGDGVDCTTSRCAIYTRNDHTALRDRIQDVYLPVGFAG
jgi:hypothetical protein